MSSNEEIFDAAAPPYQEALETAGYSHKLVYQDQASTSTSRKRTRSKPTLWFHPPWAENVKTNLGADFLKVVSAFFSKGHPLYKIFNRNRVKISYRTTANMAKIISRHNNKLMSKIPNSQLPNRQKAATAIRQLALRDGGQMCPW